MSAVAILHHRRHAQDWADAWFTENRPRFCDDVAMMEAFRVAEHQAPTGSYATVPANSSVFTVASPVTRQHTAP